MLCKVFWITQGKIIGINAQYIHNQFWAWTYNVQRRLKQTLQVQAILEKNTWEKESKAMFTFKANMNLSRACFAKPLFNYTLNVAL